MNFKPFFAILAAMPLVFTGCHPEQDPPVITAESITVSADAHSDKLTYSIENPIDGETIKAESNQDWIHSFDYSTENTINFEVDANISADPRTATLTLSYPTAQSITVNVEQMAAGESIALNPENLSFLPEGGELSVTVNSGRSWVMTGSSDWVSPSIETGDPGAEVVFTAQANETDEPREASFEFICGTNKVTLNIQQSFTGRILVEKPQYDIPGTVNTFTVNIQSNMEDVTVEIPEDITWLTEVTTKAMQDMAFEFSATENEGEETRTAIIVFSNADATEQVLISQEPSFPADVLTRIEDETFKTYLQENFDTDGDGTINRAEADAVTSITLTGSEMMSAAGIEYFENLESIDFTSNVLLSELSMAGRTGLKNLNVNSCNRLETLDLTGCEGLETLNIGLCSALTSVDLSDMTALNTLTAYSSGLTSIDVTANTQLVALNVNGTGITTVDLSQNTELVSLSLTNEFSSIDLSANTKLESLTVGGANLTSLDLSANTALRELNVSNSGFVSLDHSMCPDLTRVTYDYCSNLTTIDVSKNTRMSYISCYMCNALTTVIMYEGQQVSSTFGVSDEMIQYVPFDYPDDLSAGIKDENLRKYILNLYDYNYSTGEVDGKIDAEEAARVTSLDLSGRGDIVSLTGLDYFTNLETVNASENMIEEVDFFFNTKLKEVNLSGNKLTTIDFSKNQEITNLDLSYNQLTSVDNLPDAVVDLDLSNNKLTSVEASYLSNLRDLNISYNEIVECDVHYDQALVNFDCSHNQIEQINVWTLTALENFNISNNPLLVIGTYYTNPNGTFLEPQLDYLTALLSLNCSNTQVSELDLSACLLLQQLIATDCPELKDVFIAPGQTIADMQLDDDSVVKEKTPETAE